MHRDLIFDVGAYDGADSAYYLHKGFRVVGIEANPLMIPRLQERFAGELEEGRYTLVDVAIGSHEGEQPFWICDDTPALSSHHREIAGYGGARHHETSVRTRRFSSIIEEFGTPHYAKVDIEGADHLCLEDMPEAPDFLSVELGSHSTGVGVVHRLEELGYTRFKVISQLSYRQPGLVFARAKAMLHPTLGNWMTPRGRRRDGDWEFPTDASGPFGEATRGSWLSASAARELIGLLMQVRSNCDWYDVHAGA